MKHDKFNLDYFLDFIKCNNDMIFKIIPKKLPIKDYLIPYVKRYTAKKNKKCFFFLDFNRKKYMFCFGYWFFK